MVYRLMPENPSYRDIATGVPNTGIGSEKPWYDIHNLSHYDQYTEKTVKHNINGITYSVLSY